MINKLTVFYNMGIIAEPLIKHLLQVYGSNARCQSIYARYDSLNNKKPTGLNSPLRNRFCTYFLSDGFISVYQQTHYRMLIG